MRINHAHWFWVAIFVSMSSVALGQGMLDDGLDVAKDLQPLDAVLRDQAKKWFDKCDAAEAKYGRESAMAVETSDRSNPLAVHGARLLEYARKHPGTPESFTCLSYIVDFGEAQEADLYRSACAELIAHEKDNPRLSWLCSRSTNATVGLELMGEFLARLSRASTNQTVQAAATFHEAQLYDNAVTLRSQLDFIRTRLKRAGFNKAMPALNALEKRPLGELQSHRDELLKLVMGKYSAERSWVAERTFGRLDYKFHEDSQQPTFGEMAKRLAFDIEHLRAGCIAPDFQGTRLDGVPFRLSEQRGKPVLLMFSYKGCGACEAMYPALRKVQERFGGKGFSVVGIMADKNADTIEEAVHAGTITWPCIWDGRPGPIATQYHVTGFPTVLLLDRRGRIKSLALRTEEELAPAIEQLLNEPAQK